MKLWRRTITSVLAMGLVLGVAMPVAYAHGAKSETYTAEAPTPTLGADPEGCLSLEEPCSEFDECASGLEGVNKESHDFQLPTSGRLSVVMTGFTGDWDLYLLDTGGNQVGSSTGGNGTNVEAVNVVLDANQAVTIVACNFSGGPSATVELTFVKGALVSVGDVAVYEGDAGTRTAVFTVSLSRPAKVPVTVGYAAVDGVATGSSDYTATSGTVTFPVGTTSASVKVAVIGDSVDESNESFSVRLSPRTGSILSDGTGVATIVDDDPGDTTLRLAIGDVSVHEGDSGARKAAFNVTLSQPSTSNVTVNFATVEDTAAGADFTPRTGTLSFAPGTTTLNVKVPIVPDDLAEGDERFLVRLSSPSGATIADGVGDGTIIDDD